MNIGIDIEEVGRFENMLKLKPKLIKKIFFENELDYSQKKRNQAQTLCGIWCAKEAIIKAISEFELIDVRDINICHEKNGAPFVEPIKNLKLSISISHTKHYATAVAIASKIE